MLNILIPKNELKITASRSTGAGGQNVNKVASKITLRWPIFSSRVLTAEQKSRLASKLANRLSRAKEIIITAQASRDQAQNKKQALILLQRLVQEALKQSPKRLATKSTRQSKEKTLATKKKRSQLKNNRRINLNKLSNY